MKKHLLFLLFLVSIPSFAQKGIFKQGEITPKTYTEELSYQIKEDVIFIDVVIAEKTYTFLLDTGAPTTLSSKIKGDFKILEEEEIMDASQNKQLVKYITIPKIEVGKLTFINFAAMYEHLDLFDSLHIVGILGANMISQSVWNFDLANQKITLSNQIDKNLLKSFQKVKVKKTETGTPTLTLTYFNKMKEKNIFFDTGYNDFFYLSTTMFQRLKDANLVSNYIEGSGINSMSAFGVSEGQTYLTPLQVSIGQYTIPPFISDVDQDEESNLGSVWLKYYHTILYKNHLYFKATNQQQFKTNYQSLGISTHIVNQELQVSFVWNNTTAFEKGIQTNDKILSIDGQSLEGLSEQALKQYQEKLKKANKVQIEINTKGNLIELTKKTLIAL